MKNWTGLIAMGVLLALLVPGALAQDEPAVPAQPAEDEDEPAAVEPTEPEVKRHFGLYVAASWGTASADEVNTSIRADQVNKVEGFLELDEMDRAGAAIGWQLPEGKGDWRLVFNGFKETGYDYSADALQHRISNPMGGTVLMDLSCPIEEIEQECPVPRLARWWRVESQDGNVTATKTTPLWNAAMDDMFEEKEDGTLKKDGQPDFGVCTMISDTMEQCGEVRYDLSSPERVVQSRLSDTLENQIQTLDAFYGREFGGRRYSSRWFGGLRYFVYEGNLLAAAWVNLDSPGEGFTDGGLLRLLSLHQETTGLGPVGQWEVDFNFFDKGVVLYLLGEAGFTFNSMEVDSGPFFQVEEGGGDTSEFVSDRLRKTLDKSTWQNAVEFGVKVNFKNGLQLEAGYSINGYLDVVLTPDLLQIGSPNENPQTTTQDFVIDAAHVGVAYQF